MQPILPTAIFVLLSSHLSQRHVAQATIAVCLMPTILATPIARVQASPLLTAEMAEMASKTDAAHFLLIAMLIAMFTNEWVALRLMSNC